MQQNIYQRKINVINPLNKNEELEESYKIPFIHKKIYWLYKPTLKTITVVEYLLLINYMTLNDIGMV